jgi:hypothetical protein
VEIMESQGFQIVKLRVVAFIMLACIGGAMVVAGDVELSELNGFYESLGIAAGLCGLPTIITALVITRGQTTQTE